MNAIASRDDFWFLNNHVTVEISKADTADGVSVLRLRLPYDEAPPLHVHNAEDEIFHIIQGEARFKIGDIKVIGQAGDTVLAPRGIPHGFRVTSAEGAEFLIVTHGGFEHMVRELARPALWQAPPEPVVPSREEQVRLADTCHSFGIDLLGPPIE